MPRYLAQFSYTPEALKAMTQNPADRTETIRALVEKLGGKMEAFYYSFGEYDGFAIVDMPSEEAQVAFVMAAVSPGHLKATRTTVLLTAQEFAAGLQQAKGVTFQGPRAG